MATSALTGAAPHSSAWPGTRTYIGYIARQVFAERGAWRIIVVAAAIEAVFALTAPYLARITLDEALPTGAHSTLALLASAVVAAAGYAAWASWLQRRSAIAIQHRVEATCLSEVLGALLDKPYQELMTHGYGQTNETTAAASATVRLAVQSLVNLVTRGASAIATFALIAWWFPGLALITVAATLLTVALSAVHALREAALAKNTMRLAGEQRGFYQCLLQSLPALRASGAEGRLADSWRQQFETQAVAAVAQEWATVARKDVLRTGQQILGLGSMCWLVCQVMSGEVSIGQFMTASMLTTSLVHTVTECAGIGLDVWAMRSHFERVGALFQGSARQERAIFSQEAPPFCQGASETGLRLRGVWFRYTEQSPWVLREYDASFPVAQVSVLKAASGAGKTTALRLLAGLLRPTRGEVLVGGVDPCLHPNLVAYLPQQASLFEGSLVANLKTLSGASIEQIRVVAELTGLSAWVQSLPMGMETLVSAGGRNLSSGQRQLVLLTAVFAKGRPVVLLDEATSQLDADAIARVRWPALTKGRTVVIVEHTDNVVRSLSEP